MTLLLRRSNFYLSIYFDLFISVFSLLFSNFLLRNFLFYLCLVLLHFDNSIETFLFIILLFPAYLCQIVSVSLLFSVDSSFILIEVCISISFYYWRKLFYFIQFLFYYLHFIFYQFFSISLLLIYFFFT